MALGKFMNNFYIPVVPLFYRTLCVTPSCSGLIPCKNLRAIALKHHKLKTLVILKIL